jgi:FkbM family methyltransferase
MNIKSLIFKFLGLKKYLLVISKMFFGAYRLGLLKNKREFDFHYFVRKIIRSGNCVMDIGANLGYYSRIFSYLVGDKGKVLAVEPVGLFRDVLKRNVKGRANVEIIPYALGEEHNKEITMGVPSGHKIFRHGLTHVVEKQNDKIDHEFSATLKDPAILFSDLEVVDYIKCDVEGYEIHIIPRMKEIIERHKPFIQIETSGSNKSFIFKFLKDFGYSAFWVKREKLIGVEKVSDYSYGDLLFVHSSKGDMINEFSA